ncbi:MAG: O-antigen ligase family protein [Parcubacteria group bacterium]
MKNLTKYVIWGGLLAIPFIPFIVPGSMFFPFIAGKGFTFRILVEVLFGLFALLAFIDPDYRPKLSWITKAVLVFVLAIFVSDIFGANPYKSFWSNYERMEGFVLLAHLAMYYVVASSVFKTRVEWSRLFDVSILASLLVSLYGFLQLFGLATINQGGVRVDSTFGNAAYLAIYLVFHIFLCLYFMASPGQKKWKLYTYGIIGLLEMIVLYYTATRGAILGLIGGLFLTALLLAWRGNNKILRKIGYGVIGASVLFVGLFVALKDTSFVKTSPVLSRFSTLSGKEFKTQGRYYVWPMAVKGIMERPVLGWGQENFNFVFNKNYNPAMFGQEEWFDRTHNVVLDWLIAGGLVGFVAYFSIYIALFYYIWRKESSLSILEKSVLTGMISAYIFHNIFVFDNLISYIIFMTVLAFIHSINVDAKQVGNFYKKTFSKDALNYIIYPGVAIVTVVTIYFVNIPALSANTTLIKALQNTMVEKKLELFKEVFSYNSFGSTEAIEQLVQETTKVFYSQVPDKAKQDFYNFAKTKIEEKVASVPNDARYLVFAGSFFNRTNQPDVAIKYLERAVIESPKKQSIYFELGSSYLSKGDRVKATEMFRKAYELKPEADESKIIYAVGAIYTRNIEVLNKLSKVIDQETILTDDRFLRAYMDIGDHESVIKIMNARLQRDPNNKQYSLWLAGAYASLGQKQKAVDIINGIINRDKTFKEEGEGYIKQIQNS